MTLPSLLEAHQVVKDRCEQLENANLDVRKTVQDVKEVAGLTQAWSPFMITMLQEANERLDLLKGRLPSK